jgi:hypothetical protein
MVLTPEQIAKLADDLNNNRVEISREMVIDLIETMTHLSKAYVLLYEQTYKFVKEDEMRKAGKLN